MKYYKTLSVTVRRVSLSRAETLSISIRAILC